MVDGVTALLSYHYVPESVATSDMFSADPAIAEVGTDVDYAYQIQHANVF